MKSTKYLLVFLHKSHIFLNRQEGKKKSCIVHEIGALWVFFLLLLLRGGWRRGEAGAWPRRSPSQPNWHPTVLQQTHLFYLFIFITSLRVRIQEKKKTQKCAPCMCASAPLLTRSSSEYQNRSRKMQMEAGAGGSCVRTQARRLGSLLSGHRENVSFLLLRWLFFFPPDNFHFGKKKMHLTPLGEWRAPPLLTFHSFDW